MPKDTTLEMDSLQNELWMKRTPQERAHFASAMFAAARSVMLASLPGDLSKREVEEIVYFRTYGHSLSADFFER
jgi:hypothetical protein